MVTMTHHEAQRPSGLDTHFTRKSPAGSLDVFRSSFSKNDMQGAKHRGTVSVYSSSESDNTSSSTSTSRRKRRRARHRVWKLEMEALRERQVAIAEGYSFDCYNRDDDDSVSSLSGYDTEYSTSDGSVGFDGLCNSGNDHRDGGNFQTWFGKKV